MQSKAKNLDQHNDSQPEASTPSLQESLRTYPSTQQNSPQRSRYQASREEQKQFARDFGSDLVIGFPSRNS
jgi:hypothetical protein